MFIEPTVNLHPVLTTIHRGGETLQVLSIYGVPALLSPSCCLAMAGAGSPSHANINQENRGHKNKKYLWSPGTRKGGKYILLEDKQTVTESIRQT